MQALVLNPGSSTLRASTVDPRSGQSDGMTIDWPVGEDAAAGDIVQRVLVDRGRDVDAVGYRVVHGGPTHRGPIRVDSSVIADVQALDVLAPLHNRRAAAIMRAGLLALPDVPHVACFDTSFHADLPEEAWRYPLPDAWVERWGIRRFGFHGLSVAWAVDRAAVLLRRPPEDLGLVVAHLGSGASITSVDRGRSVGTSMGFTPLEGPMMATRAGSVDPGILLHLLRQGMSIEELSDGIAAHSGLQALAGTSDAREIERSAASGDRRAGLAIDIFTSRVAAYVAAAVTPLPRFDALVFTGGIGEHSAMVRSRVAGRLRHLAVPGELAVPAGDGIAAVGPPAVLVIEAHEEIVIAREVASLLDRDEPGRRRA